MSAQPKVPPLQAGDRLTRAEFERRYEAMPHVTKAELLEGVVYMPSPVSDAFHAGPHFDLIGWLGIYRFATPGIRGGDNGTLRLDLDNDPQPDAYIRILPEHGGQARVSADGFVEGSPEWIGEVAASSASYDLHVKLHVYRRNGVREYVVWRVYDRVIDWFVSREGKFERMPMGTDGIFRSEVLPGLWLDPQALLDGDLVRLNSIAQQGLASPEHAAFVAAMKK